MKRVNENKRDVVSSPILRRGIVGTLTVAMLVGGATGAFAHGNDKNQNKNQSQSSNSNNSGYKSKVQFNLNFRDVSENDMKWAYSHIIRLASKQVFNGYEDGSFKPGNTITRVEAIVAAVRLLGLKEEAESEANMKAELNFTDADKIEKKYSWAVGYLAVALKNDLFDESTTALQPEKAADRLWSAILLVKALGLEDEAKAKMGTTLTFKDAKDIPAGSVGYVAVAVEKGLITGYSDNTFKPNKSVTRAELAALLDRADEQLPEEQSAQAISGTIVSLSGSALTVKKADGTTAALTLASDVFIFRENTKVAASALKAGDQLFIRTYEGKVVFIDVLTAAHEDVVTADAGTLNSFTLNASGKLSTLTLVKTVNGVSSNVTYNVSADVKIAGGDGTISPNKVVSLTLVNGVVTAIAIQA
ncbi:S-layer homology domain-containing protein [Cohnella fermenti]|uniref:S-layer homology domain-containing protein n=1 Tax=Cohnella fermenti TaxID=2565925 RepID=A0A4S4BPT0_9BACL|nr:S-layer homology domain-containing protein [Cohnella fermenti]THF76903.1 S-layer homology domain-containing protein [Cohnella fermenti]